MLSRHAGTAELASGMLRRQAGSGVALNHAHTHCAPQVIFFAPIDAAFSTPEAAYIDQFANNSFLDYHGKPEPPPCCCVLLSFA